jgi:hypothetical protein
LYPKRPAPTSRRGSTRRAGDSVRHIRVDKIGENRALAAPAKAGMPDDVAKAPNSSGCAGALRPARRRYPDAPLPPGPCARSKMRLDRPILSRSSRAAAE